MMNGELVNFGYIIGVLLDVLLLWIYDGVDYFFFFKDFFKEEMVIVVKSM